MHAWEAQIGRECERLAACEGNYSVLHEAMLARRLAWWNEHGKLLALAGPLPRQAYTLFICHYLGLTETDAPVVYEDAGRIVWRSINRCPTLEACVRLGLDTRVVCREGTERSVEALIRCLDDRLRFGRRYETGLRPYAGYCEETIWLIAHES